MEQVKKGGRNTPQRIIEATIRSVGKQGLSNLRSKHICQATQMSSGIIYHYFDTKENLIYQTYIYMIRHIHKETVAMRLAEKDPVMRLRKTVDIHFSPLHLTQEAAQVWPQLWLGANNDSKTKRLLKIYTNRFLNNMVYDLAQLMPSKRARSCAFGLVSMIHGAWLEYHICGNASRQEVYESLHNHITDLVTKQKRNE